MIKSVTLITAAVLALGLASASMADAATRGENGPRATHNSHRHASHRHVGHRHHSHRHSRRHG